MCGQQNKEDEGAGEQNTCCKWLVIYPQSPFQDMWNFLFLLAAIYIASMCDTHSVCTLIAEKGERVCCLLCDCLTLLCWCHSSCAILHRLYDTNLQLFPCARHIGTLCCLLAVGGTQYCMPLTLAFCWCSQMTVFLICDVLIGFITAYADDGELVRRDSSVSLFVHSPPSVLPCHSLTVGHPCLCAPGVQPQTHGQTLPVWLVLVGSGRRLPLQLV